MKKIAVIVSIVGVLAIVGAVTWLFVSGKVVWAGSTTYVGTTKIVCDNELVRKFNDSMFYVIRGADTTATIDTEGLKNIKTDIKGKEGYAADPSCQTILYLIAVYEEDYEGSKAAYEAVNDLYDKNLFANSNIRGNQPLFMYESSVFALSPEGKTQGGVGGE